MLIRDNVWDAIREQFSEEEKVELRKHVTGEAICPRGFVVDVESIPQRLKIKLRTAIDTFNLNPLSSHFGAKR